MAIRHLLLCPLLLVSCGKSGTIEDTSVTTTTDTGITSTATTSTATTDSGITDTGTAVTTDTATTGTGSTTTTDTGGWEPTEGRYTLNPGAVISNDCGDAFVVPEPNDTATARFSWDGDKISIGFDRDPLVECDWEFPGFPLCVIMDESEVQQGTTLTFQNSIDGEWTAPEEMFGTFNLDIDCSGNGCEMFAGQMNISEFPCSASLEYEGEL
jgi:hypothetical protein